MKFTQSSPFKNSFLAPVITLFALALLLMSGCADENPDLVNPQGGNDSITVRFVNFSGDELPRTFSLEGIQGLPVGYGQSSVLQRSESDSASVGVFSGSTVNFQTIDKIRFGKNTVQTIVALPSRDSAVGRLVALSASYVQPTNTNNAFVRFFNAVYDTNEVYSIRIGCPNGAMFGGLTQYGGFGNFAELPPGEIVISLLSRNALQTTEAEKIIGTFRLNVTSRRPYTIFAFKKGAQPELLLLDELSGGTQALQPIMKVTENTVEIRTINFSQASVDIFNQTKKTIASGIDPNYIGRYESLVTCDGTGADSLSIFAGGQGQNSGFIATSLDVLKKYSIIVLDSGGLQANYSILVPPSRNSFKTPGMASVRVVNATTFFKNITVSLGAQNDSNTSGFRSGGTLATALLKGVTSETVEIPAGNTPLAVFTSAQPPQLLFTSPVNIQAGEEYLLIVQNSTNGEVRASLINAGAVGQSAEFLQRGAFLQVVHAVPGMDKIGVSVDNSLSNATLFYRSSLATVVAAGSITVRAGSAFKNISVSADSSVLIVVAGTSDAPEILTFSKPNTPLSTGTLERRIIHASKEVGAFTALVNDTVDWAEKLAENLTYGQATDFQMVNTERRLSIIFIDPLSQEMYFNKKTYFRTENISFPVNKRYSVIFAGAKDKGGYVVITQQEF